MANFKININQYIHPFYDIPKSITKESCTNDITTYSIGFQKLTTLPSPIIFLLDNYTGNPKNFLHIKNVKYYIDNVLNPNINFIIKYAGINLQPVVGVTTINIQNVNNGDIIPDLELSSSITISEVNEQKIEFEYAIEDTLGNVTEYITTNIKLLVIKCSSFVAPLVSDICTNDIVLYGENITQHYITVTVPQGENLKLRMHTIDKGIGTASFIIQRGKFKGCNPLEPYENILISTAKDIGKYSYFIYNPIVPASITVEPPYNVVNLRIWLFVHELTGSNASLTNTYICNVDILDSLDNIIHTVVLSESNIGI